MSKSSTGLLLKKNFPHWHTVIVLDLELGKIVGIPDGRHVHKLCVGALINYHITTNQKNHRLANTEIINIPLTWARDDIRFLHQIFELLYYFTPLDGGGAAPVFEFIQFLYKSDSHELLNGSLNKKIFLCKLLITLGLHPENIRFQTISFHRLALESIDSFLQQNLDLISEYELDQWLLECIGSHPCIRYFKAIQILPRDS